MTPLNFFFPCGNSSITIQCNKSHDTTGESFFYEVAVVSVSKGFDASAFHKSFKEQEQERAEAFYKLLCAYLVTRGPFDFGQHVPTVMDQVC